MVREEFGVAASRTSSSWVLEAAFAALLLLFYVEFTPFLPRDPASVAARDMTSMSGDLLRQASFLAVFLVIAGYAIARRGLSLATVVPLPMVFLLAWCLMSSTWSSTPDITFRRAALQVILVWSTFLSVDLLGTERSLAIWRYVLLAVLATDWLSVIFVKAAIHQPDDFEKGLTGDWRGVHTHKNIAGAICANSAMVFFYWWLEDRRHWRLAALAAAVVFLVMTWSKTSMALLPVALLGGALYGVAMKSELDRSILFVLAGLILAAGAAAVALEWQAIAHFLQDPQNVTGRTAIWDAELRYARDHPIFGSGFGTFANPGVRSPIFYYVGTSWVASIGEGHNAYLELLLTTGTIGLLLALIALVIAPFVLLFRRDAIPLGMKQLLFTLFVFLFLHDFVESDFLGNSGPTWGMDLMTLALLYTGRQEANSP